MIPRPIHGFAPLGLAALATLLAPISASAYGYTDPAAAPASVSCVEVEAPHFSRSESTTPPPADIDVTIRLGSFGGELPVPQRFPRSSARTAGPDGWMNTGPTAIAVGVRVRAYCLASLGQRALFRRAAHGTESSPHTAPPALR